ncbi:hypothetical protein P3342_002380 [Pyrenophora teres f. teres]|nr:hypothetical protein P3342_002380 [Pyrenophora teres f. teres]
MSPEVQLFGFFFFLGCTLTKSTESILIQMVNWIGVALDIDHPTDGLELDVWDNFELDHEPIAIFVI